jgi:hypothetical protein
VLVLLVVEVDFHNPNRVEGTRLEVAKLVALVVLDLYMELNLLVVVVLMELYRLVLELVVVAGIPVEPLDQHLYHIMDFGLVVERHPYHLVRRLVYMVIEVV